MRSDPSAYLFDLDGTLLTDRGPIPGAAGAVADVRRRGVPIRFVTNITRVPRATILDWMRGAGFKVDERELFTPLITAGRIIEELEPEGRVAPFLPERSLVDLATLELAGGTAPAALGPGENPAVVLVGDLGDHWNARLLNEAFRYIMAGSCLVALQKNRYWQSREGLTLDSGPYVAALEFATGTEAVISGKPGVRFFQAVLGDLDAAGQLDAGRPPAMVGDDIWGDVGGAQAAGIEGWLVKTGKFRKSVLADSGIVPDRILESVADLAG